MAKEDVTVSDAELAEILRSYAVGEYRESGRLTRGTVQTNIWVRTTDGSFVLRLYHNRTKSSVAFETGVLCHLAGCGFPCPVPHPDRQGRLVGTYRQRPYVLLGFMEGEHEENLNQKQYDQLIQKVAQLHILTRNFCPPHKEARWNYSADFCLWAARDAAFRLNTPEGWAKLGWLKREVRGLELPASLPKGVCHGDLNASNLLFKNGSLSAMLDFDDANYTFLLFDVVGLVEWAAWPHTNAALNFDKARRVVGEYGRRRPLTSVETAHLFDVYKLSVLIDCVWFFERGGADDFYEKRKVDFLNGVGREEFCRRLFG